MKLLIKILLIIFQFSLINGLFAHNDEYSIVSELFIKDQNNVTCTYIVTLKAPSYQGSAHDNNNSQACNIVFSPTTNINNLISASFNGQPIELIIYKSKNNLQFAIPSNVEEGSEFSIVLHFLNEPSMQASLHTITATNNSGGMNYYFKDNNKTITNNSGSLLNYKNIISKPCGDFNSSFISDYDLLTNVSIENKFQFEILVLNSFLSNDAEESSQFSLNSSIRTVVLTTNIANGFEINNFETNKQQYTNNNCYEKFLF
ncbi:MAG: hypothetical protein C0596_02690 [Marinilabiliales bacterium]|nr:MAG: hypothetical protein C0596_02690 [Marinilabiliales bacterium]